MTEEAVIDIQDMTEEELYTFVVGVVDGKVFTSHHIPPNIAEQVLYAVFMPLVLGALDGWSEAQRNEIGTIWEYYAKAGPKSINGFPMFTSFHVMSKTDWARADVLIEEQLRRKTEYAENETKKDQPEQTPTDPE